MNLHDLFYRLMDEYGTILASVKANSDFKNPFREIISKEIPQALTSLVNISDPYEIVGSYGKGRWTDVPWIAVFDRRITKSAQKGVYIVYLVNKDRKELYLTLEVSATEAMSTEINPDNANTFLSIAGVHNSKLMSSLRQKAHLIQQHISHFNFSTDNNISSGSPSYDNGAVLYKRYSLGDLPADNILKFDLMQMIEAYRQYYQYINGELGSPISAIPHSFGIFDSWEIIDENTAVKNCDKSFFEHHGSGVPKGICWFFGADELTPGQNGSLTLLYDGKEYQGRLANDTTDRRRVRIFWNTELSKLFNLHRNEENPRAVFHKITADLFEVSFEKGEEKMVMPIREMSVKDTVSHIKTYIASKGFTYEDGLIENFYLSLKSKPFVILAGTSGTGKTRLVRLFAEAMGATANNGRYKMVPVRPDWSDSSDLFGHVDLNGKFVPGTIIDFVKRAEMDLSRPYFLCLDEMNLARVEYYLSDILSVIETRDFQGGAIVSAPLVDSTYYGSDTAAAGRYGTVLLPENLYIIGTVNMDETTFPFSRKVLDRANTIEFSYVDLIPHTDVPFNMPAPMDLPNTFLKTEYLLLDQCADRPQEIGKYCEELQRINQVLQKANAHVGYRVRDEIVFYLLNNQEAELLDENDAMDNEIMQKILPRIQGSSASVKRMLCELFKICAGDYEGYQVENDDIASKMFKAAQNAKYKKSAEKIAFMVRRYEEDGFTSYWL